MATITDCKHFYLSFAGYVFAIQCFNQSSNIKKRLYKKLFALYRAYFLKKIDKVDYFISINHLNNQDSKDNKKILINKPQSSTQIINSIIYLLENASNDSLIFLHASASITPKGACLFLGDSGAGKSTIVKLLKNYQSFADDSVIIKKSGSSYLIYQTPFVDKNRPTYLTKKGIKLDRVFFIQKGKQNIHELIHSKQEILSHLSTQLWLDKRNKKQKIAFLFELTKTIPFYNLSFTKEAETLNDYFSSII